MAKVIERSGDAVEAFFSEGYDCFMHNCNCHSVMGAGVAKAVRKKIPELYEADQATRFMKPEKKLGSYTTYSFGDPSDEFPIAINLYGQLNYGIGKRHINYAALTCSLLNACGFILDGVDKARVVRVCLPKIGSGLAGGDWGSSRRFLSFVLIRLSLLFLNCRRIDDNI